MKNQKPSRQTDSANRGSLHAVVRPHVKLHKPDLLAISCECTLIAIQAGKVQRQLEEAMASVDTLHRRSREASEQVRKTIEACERASAA
jgi:hypothetical protein